MITTLTTSKTFGSYWSGRGNYQSKADLVASLVPGEGSSTIPAIETFRVAQNAYYEIFNNGGANIGGRDGGRTEDWRMFLNELPKELRQRVKTAFSQYRQFKGYAPQDHALYTLLDEAMDFILEGIDVPQS